MKNTNGLTPNYSFKNITKSIPENAKLDFTEAKLNFGLKNAVKIKIYLKCQ